jgi:hypothetical protein
MILSGVCGGERRQTPDWHRQCAAGATRGVRRPFGAAILRWTLVKTEEAVEKVGAGPVNDLESSSQRPEIGVSGVRSGISNGHEGVFQQAGKLRRWANIVRKVRGTSLGGIMCAGVKTL